jgi:uncharacterized membrane protein YedE/YeeE
MEMFLYPLVGGILIGLSSSTMLGGIGRITGISGIIGNLFQKPNSELAWRYAFLFGLLAGGLLLVRLKPELFQYSLEAPLYKVILAGLLVGYGTRLGSGCTSGHGVCGMARLAKRSFVATGVFMFVAIITVAIRGVL